VDPVGGLADRFKDKGTVIGKVGHYTYEIQRDGRADKEKLRENRLKLLVSDENGLGNRARNAHGQGRYPGLMEKTDMEDIMSINIPKYFVSSLPATLEKDNLGATDDPKHHPAPAPVDYSGNQADVTEMENDKLATQFLRTLRVRDARRNCRFLQLSSADPRVRIDQAIGRKTEQENKIKTEVMTLDQFLPTWDTYCPSNGDSTITVRETRLEHGERLTENSCRCNCLDWKMPRLLTSTPGSSSIRTSINSPMGSNKPETPRTKPKALEEHGEETPMGTKRSETPRTRPEALEELRKEMLAANPFNPERGSRKWGNGLGRRKQVPLIGTLRPEETETTLEMEVENEPAGQAEVSSGMEIDKESAEIAEMVEPAELAEMVEQSSAAANCSAEAPENEQPEGDQTDIEDFMAEHYAILEEAEREMKDNL
jgi:hypothetical protein